MHASIDVCKYRCVQVQMCKYRYVGFKGAFGVTSEQCQVCRLILHINIHSQLGDACWVREFINLGAAQRGKARCIE